jgi:hypothetical protein
MDATQGLAAILRDARKGALLRMRSEIYSQPRKRAIQYSETSMMESKGRSVLDTQLKPVIGLAEGETRWRGMTAVFGRHLP